MALYTNRSGLQRRPLQPSRCKIVDFDFDFTINLVSIRKDQDREIISAESPTQTRSPIDFVFNQDREFSAYEAKTEVSFLHRAQFTDFIGTRFLNFTTHVIRQRSRDGTTPSRIGKNMKIRQRQISEEFQRAMECFVRLTRKPDDDIATQGGVR